MIYVSARFKGWDVAFVLWREENTWVLTVVGVDRPEQMEKVLAKLARVGVAVPAAVDASAD